jgi:hypothetical protein
MSHRSRKTMQTPSSECGRGRGRGRGREEPRERGNSKMPVGEGHEAFLFLSKGVAVAVFGMDRTEVLMQHTRQSLPRVRFRGEDAESRAEGAALPMEFAGGSTSNSLAASGVRSQVAGRPESRVPSPESRLAGCSRNPAFAGPITRRSTRHSLDFCCTSYPDAAT